MKLENMKRSLLKSMLVFATAIVTLFGANTVFATEAYETVEAPKYNAGNTFTNVTVNGSSATSLYLNGNGRTYFKFTTGNRSANAEYYNLYLRDYDIVVPYIYLYTDEDMTNCIFWDALHNSDNGTNINLGKLSNNTTYYALITGVPGNDKVVDYTIKLTSVTDDCGDTGATAKAVSLGKEVTGYSENQYDTDCYSFKTSSSEAFYWFQISCVSGQVGDFGVYEDADCLNPIKEYSYRVNVNGNGVFEKDTEYYNCGKLEKNKTYYVKVAPWDTRETKYKFKVSYAKDNVKDTTSGTKELSLNNTKTYSMDSSVDVDCFKVKTTGYKNYTLTFSNTGVKKGQLYITVYSGADCLNNQKVLEKSCTYKKSLSSKDAKLKLKANKTYYIVVSTQYDTGKYKIGVSATAPASLKATSKSKKVNLSWKKVDQASGYEVYRATSKDGKYTKIKTITNAKTLKYVDSKKLKTGKKYYYKVRAYKRAGGKKYYTAYSSIKSVKVKK